jgi:hypothetical protein
MHVGTGSAPGGVEVAHASARAVVELAEQLREDELVDHFCRYSVSQRISAGKHFAQILLLLRCLEKRPKITTGLKV